eukprot:m.478339 g.478339  ORF g.478339 m.478339 type:complete len:663 (+) comp21121_c0_seq1:69-2057(+)
MGTSHSQFQLPPTISVPVTEPKEGESAIYRHYQYGDALVDVPFPEEPDVNTAFALFSRSVKMFRDSELLGERAFEDGGSRGAFQWETYGQVDEQVKKIGAGLLTLGLNATDHVGILSINRPEWIKALLSIWSQSMTCVPLYDTLGANAVRFILEHSEAKVVFCSNAKLDSILEHVDEVPSVTHVIQFEDLTEEHADKCKSVNAEVLSLNDLIKRGEETPAEPNPPENTLNAYIMYTSGTTGDPKGVQLTHRNIMASTAGLFHTGMTINSDDVYLSYLPLAHSMETILQMFGMCGGARVGFYQGDVKKLTDDILELRPTVFAGVPRVYSRIYDRVQSQLAGSWVKRNLFETAYDAQVAHVRKGERSSFWDGLVFNKTKQRLGGRLRMVASGAAPLPAHIHEFLKVAFGAEVVQGYGMTENCAAAMAGPLGYTTVGTVGCPLPCTEVKLVDVPEMEYTAKDEQPRGEVCLRGANIFPGYFKLDEKTKETLDEDGWLHTGDIGRWNADGSLSIIDRKKNIFKLAQGEFVAAEEVENLISKSKFVSQIFVYGNSEKTAVVAVIVPDKDVTLAWGQEHHVEGDFSAIAGSDAFRAAVLESVKAEGKAAKLASFKVPKAIHIETEINDAEQGFHVENECLTPTFKLRRPQLKKRYEAAIETMYASLPA